MNSTPSTNRMIYCIRQFMQIALIQFVLWMQDDRIDEIRIWIIRNRWYRIGARIDFMAWHFAVIVSEGECHWILDGNVMCLCLWIRERHPSRRWIKDTHVASWHFDSQIINDGDSRHSCGSTNRLWMTVRLLHIAVPVQRLKCDSIIIQSANNVCSLIHWWRFFFYISFSSLYSFSSFHSECHLCAFCGWCFINSFT